MGSLGAKREKKKNLISKFKNSKFLIVYKPNIRDTRVYDTALPYLLKMEYLN